MNRAARSWNIICWNVCGIGSDEKHFALRSHIDNSGCLIICLQETKRDHFDHSYLRKFCPKRFE